MPKVRQAETSFVAGEISPLAFGRSDTSFYRAAAERLLNLRLLAQGGVTVRPPLLFLLTIPQLPARLIPFVFNDAQRYPLVLSNARLDVYLPDGTLATTLVGAPWTAAMLPRINWASFGDTMFLTHPDMPMQVLRRTGATSFVLSPFAFEQASAGQPLFQPYFKFAQPGVTMTPSATTGTITLTLSAAHWVDGHAGLIVRYKKKEILVTAVVSPTLANGTVRETLPATTADADWDEPVFSAVRGYAAAVALFSSRTVFAGARSLPAGFWASKSNAFFNFDIGTAQDNEAIWEQVPEISEIRHLLTGRHLLVLTDEAFYFVPTSESRPLTPKTIVFRKQQPYGASYVRPAIFDSAAIYVQKTGAAVREGLFVDTEQAYTGDPISLLAAHLIRNPVEMDVLFGAPAQPEQYALAVNADGTLAIFHSVRAESIQAWTEWATEGAFKSVAAVGDEVFVLVERQLAAGPTWTLEKFAPDAAPLDCSKKAVSGVPTKTFSGFAHLAEKTVEVLSKGIALGPHVVSAGGAITLNALAPEVTEIDAGFWTPPKLRPLPVDFDLADGDARGLMKRLIRAVLQVDRSGSFTIEGDSVLLNFQGDDFATPPAGINGQIEFRLLGISRQCQFDVVVSTPAKVTFLSLMREVQANR